MSQELQDSIDVLQEKIRFHEGVLKTKVKVWEPEMKLRIEKKIQSHLKSIELIKKYGNE
jgi:hypothetical protein